MGRVIIKQPNGKYMLWSSIIDRPIKINMTKEDYVVFHMLEAIEEAKETINKYTKDPEYLLDEILFPYALDYEEKCELYNNLLSVGYKKEDIKDLIFVNDNLEEGALQNER